MTALTVDRLRLLHAVAFHGTIAAAAAELGYTPSAVSQQLSNLERQLGVTLLERSSRGVTLTPTGARLCERAAEILDLVQSATLEAAQRRPDAQPLEIRIGAFPSAISSIILPAAPALDGVARLTIVHLEPEQALCELQARHLDAAVIDSYEDPLDPRLARPALCLTGLLTDPLRVAINDRRLPPRSLEDLARTPWVLGGSHSRLGRATRAVLRAAGIAPEVVVESDDHWLTFEVMRHLEAATILPELALQTAPAHVVALGDLDLRCDRRIHLLTRAALRSQPAFTALERELLAAAGRWRPAGA
jgi:DNA-binding transcriptional LysR family regulator